MPAHVITVPLHALEERREEILRSLGMTLPEFERLAATSTLTGAEWDAREELEDIAFLLGETRS